MKRIAILILLSLLLLPLVSATVQISGLDMEEYNYGDKIAVSGYIYEDEDFTGYVLLKVICENLEQPYQMLPVEVEAGKKLSLSALNLPLITVSSAMSGDCNVEISLMNNGAIVETKTSPVFGVTPELYGAFSLATTKIQVGGTLELTGSVVKMNNDAVNGMAEIYFENENLSYLVDIVPITEGELSFEHQFIHGPADEYTVNIVARDYYGNSQEFKSVDSFNLVNELYLFAKTDFKYYDPGDIITIFGDVKTILQDEIDEGQIVVVFDGEEQVFDIEDKSYSIALTVPTDIATGEHTLEITAEDNYGNKGETELTINIDPKATTITSGLAVSDIMPGTELTLTPSLYDQAGALMDDSILFEVYDVDGEQVFYDYVDSNKEMTYMIDSTSKPGLWYFQVSVEDLVKQEMFNIQEYADISVEIRNDTLVVTNIGNIKYKDYLELDLKGTTSDYELRKKINLDVGESISISLADEVPSGKYSLEMPITGNVVAEYEISIIDGKSRFPWNYLYSVLAIGLIGFMIYLMYARIRPMQPKSRPSKGVTQSFVSEKKSSGLKPTKPWLKKQSREADIADFKQRVLAEIKKTEEAETRQSAAKKFYDSGLGREVKKNVLDKNVSEPAPKEDKPKNAFSMFD